MIGKREIIVNGLGNADNVQVIMQVVGHLRYTMGRIRRIVAANIEKIAYIVAAQYLDSAFRIMFLQLVATGTESR